MEDELDFLKNSIFESFEMKTIDLNKFGNTIALPQHPLNLFKKGDVVYVNDEGRIFKGIVHTFIEDTMEYSIVFLSEVIGETYHKIYHWTHVHI
jgi:hypothetical protein